MRVFRIVCPPVAIAGIVVGLVNGCSDDDASTGAATPDGDVTGTTTPEGGGGSSGGPGPADGGSTGTGDGATTDGSTDGGKPCTTPAACDDGNACTTDTCGADGLCKNVLVDEDGDGFASSALGACGTDCQPSNKLVFPGQKNHFNAPYDGGLLDAGRPDGESFDYDCSGVEEPRDPNLFTSCTVANGVCFGAGWYGFVPKCGEMGTYARCGINMGGCNPKSSDIKQSCK